MVKHCMGLPLALKVLGRILITKQKHTKSEMELRNFKGYLTRGDDVEILDVLGLSYKNLPTQLKQCFLFFGKFPYDFEIKATRLYHLWIAEGIVSVDHQEQEETMMDVAKRYLSELEQCYMVQVRSKGVPTTRRIKSCRVHNLMIDLCLSKLQSNSDIKQGRTIYYNSDQHDNDVGNLPSLADQRARRVRSLVFLRGGEEFWDKTKPNLNKFQFIRVLDLEGVEMNRVNQPESIGKLVKLRYLSLRSSSSVFWELPSSISNLKHLQILDLRVPFYPFIIPDVLWELQQLAHLYLPKRIRFDRKRTKLQLGGLSELETLVNFNSDYCDVEDLLKLSNLRKLKAEVWELGYEHMCSLVDIFALAKSPLKESKLKIMGLNFHSEVELQTLRTLLGCHHLSKLDLRGLIGMLPGHNHFSPNLTELNLWESRLEEDPMPTLEKLPSLFSLHFGRDVFMGNEMVCSPRGFPQLRTIVLDGLPNLVNWEVNKGAFPKLSHVEIHSCKKLSMIPDGLKFVTTLHEVCIHYMPEEFELKNKAKVEKGKEVEDIHKVRHNPTIKFYNTCAKVNITSMEREGTEKNGKIIEQASAETINRISEVPESSQTVLSFREHVFTETVGPDGHGRVQTFCLGPFPADIFSKPSRQYDAIKRTNEEQAAKIDLLEKKVQNLENHTLLLSRDKMTDLPRDANTNSRQVASVSSAHQPRLAAEIEPWHQEVSSSDATPSIS